MRYYDPDIARFITQDPYLGEQGMPPSLNRYLYAYGNPTVYIDLYGYDASDIFPGTWQGIREGYYGTKIALGRARELPDILVNQYVPPEYVGTATTLKTIGDLGLGALFMLPDMGFEVGDFIETPGRNTIPGFGRVGVALGIGFAATWEDWRNPENWATLSGGIGGAALTLAGGMKLGINIHNFHAFRKTGIVPSYGKLIQEVVDEEGVAVINRRVNSLAMKSHKNHHGTKWIDLKAKSDELLGYIPYRQFKYGKGMVNLRKLEEAGDIKGAEALRNDIQHWIDQLEVLKAQKKITIEEMEFTIKGKKELIEIVCDPKGRPIVPDYDALLFAYKKGTRMSHAKIIDQRDKGLGFLSDFHKDLIDKLNKNLSKIFKGGNMYHHGADMYNPYAEFLKPGEFPMPLFMPGSKTVSLIRDIHHLMRSLDKIEHKGYVIDRLPGGYQKWFGDLLE